MKKNLKVLLSALMSTSLVVGGVVTGLVLHNNNNNNEEVDENGGIKVDNIMCRGVSVKKLSTSTNSQGQAVQTFNYSVTPANASNQAVTATIKYKDGADCSAVMAVTTDTATKTISLTCKGEFAKQITLTVTSAANASATATATVDYEKKIKSVSVVSTDSYTVNLTSSKTIKDSNIYTVAYSQYSKDKTYAFTKSLSSIEIDEYNFSSATGVLDGLTNLVKKAFNEGYQITANDIWNLNSTNTYHSYLMSMSSGDYYVNFESVYQVKCTTTNQTYNISLDSGHRTYIYLDLGSFDFSGKTVGVDSIALEQSGFVF